MKNIPKITKVLLFLLAVTVFNSFSQDNILVPTFYGGLRGDYCASVINTADEGYFLAGNSHSFNVGDNSAYIIHVDSMGDTIRSNLYEGSYISKIINISDNKYAAIGQISSIDKGTDMWFLLIDSLGKVLLSRNYGGTNDDVASYIFSTDGGGFILSGYLMIPDTNYGLYNGIVTKLDSSGNIQWQTTIGDSLHPEDISAAIKTKDGEIALIGTKNSQFWSDSAKYYLVKMNLSGEILWEKTYNGLGYARGSAIIELKNGNFILLGQSGTVGDYRGVIYAIGVDSTGNVLWEKKYQRQDNDYGSFLYGANHISDNQILLTGMVNIKQQGSTTNGRAIMIDSMGEVIWINDYELENVTGGVINAKGEIILAGNGSVYSSINFGSSNGDFCIFQVDSTGKADFSKAKDYVGVKKEYSKPAFESFPSLFSAMSNHENTNGTGSINFYNLMGQKITPRFNTSTRAGSVLRNSRSGMIVANVKNGKQEYSGMLVQIK
ncbi:MAG: hypothetical protein JW863_21005 [Chitinispirillaceae bacterium]|nr:hypothetical protein [Chitinispirillaceae bacterium]